MNNNHTGFYPDQWSAAAAPRIYRLACATPNYVNTATCASANQRTIDPAFPTVLLPATNNGNLVPGSGNQINGVEYRRHPGREARHVRDVPWPLLGAARRIRMERDRRRQDGHQSLHRHLLQLRGVEQRRRLQLRGYAGGCPVSCTRTILWSKFQDITNASSGGVNFVQTPITGTVGGLSVPNGHSYNGNVAFQRDVGFNTVAEVAWVGNYVYSAGQSVDQNRLPLYVYGNVANLFNGTTAAVNNLRAVYGKYPGMGAVNQFVADLYNQVLHYNALQVSATRRLSKGLQMGMAYTYAKGMGYVGTSSGAAGYDPYIDQIGGADLIKAYYWAPTAEDRAHNLIVNYSYNIPTVTQDPGAQAARKRLAGLGHYEAVERRGRDSDAAARMAQA